MKIQQKCVQPPKMYEYSTNRMKIAQQFIYSKIFMDKFKHKTYAKNEWFLLSKIKHLARNKNLIHYEKITTC